MDTLEAIHRRRSVRKYRPEPVPEDDLRAILNAAISAPSAGNIQPWKFYIVREHGLRRALAEAAYGQTFIEEAPVCIVVVAIPEMSAKRYGDRGWGLYCIQDTAAAVQNILLASTALGYGTCWVGAFSEDAVVRVLNLPEGERPVAMVPVGKPAESPPPRPRRRDVFVWL
jgi:nitroreductase